MELPDNELMLLVKAGDLDKMKFLFERHAVSLYGFCFHMSRDKQVSEDLVQDVFLRLLKYRHSFRGDGPFIAWMYHIARNELRSKFKKMSAAGRSVNLYAVNARPSEDQSVEDQIEKRQQEADLLKAMLKLRHDDRELLTLSKLQGLRYAEIAGVLGITEVAVKVRVHRAFNELKSIYQKRRTHEM